MGLILYAPEKKNSNDPLLQIMCNTVSDEDVEMISEIEKLEERLQRPFRDIRFAVFRAASQISLLNMVYLSEISGDLRVVLMFFGAPPECLEKAYLSQPCFIITTANDFKHFRGILKKMTDLSKMIS